MEVGLYEKVSIEFTGIEVDEIICYQEKLGVDTVDYCDRVMWYNICGGDSNHEEVTKAS